MCAPFTDCITEMSNIQIDDAQKPDVIMPMHNLIELIDTYWKTSVWLFVLSFKDDDGRESYEQYYFPSVKIKDYNVMINWRNFFDRPIRNDLKTYYNIRKIATGQGDDYTIGCLLDY